MIRQYKKSTSVANKRRLRVLFGEGELRGVFFWERSDGADCWEFDAHNQAGYDAGELGELAQVCKWLNEHGLDGALERISDPPRLKTHSYCVRCKDVVPGRNSADVKGCPYCGKCYQEMMDG